MSHRLAVVVRLPVNTIRGVGQGRGVRPEIGVACLVAMIGIGFVGIDVEGRRVVMGGIESLELGDFGEMQSVFRFRVPVGIAPVPHFEFTLVVKDRAVKVSLENRLPAVGLHSLAQHALDSALPGDDVIVDEKLFAKTELERLVLALIGLRRSFVEVQIVDCESGPRARVDELQNNHSEMGGLHPEIELGLVCTEIARASTGKRLAHFRAGKDGPVDPVLLGAGNVQVETVDQDAGSLARCEGVPVVVRAPVIAIEEIVGPIASIPGIAPGTNGLAIVASSEIQRNVRRPPATPGKGVFESASAGTGDIVAVSRHRLQTVKFSRLGKLDVLEENDGCTCPRPEQSRGENECKRREEQWRFHTSSF